MKKKVETEVELANQKKAEQEEKIKLEKKDNDFNTDDYFKHEEDQFANMIGLSVVTIETIYAGYKEKDTTILNLMNENANFITTFEGYPEFLTHLI